MSKYRIKVVTEVLNDRYGSVKYYVQEKFLFFWITHDVGDYAHIKYTRNLDKAKELIEVLKNKNLVEYIDIED